jgi:predicted dehydrogenase
MSAPTNSSLRFRAWCTVPRKAEQARTGDRGEMDDLGVGIIGYGFIGRLHTLGYLDMPLYYPELAVRPRLRAVATLRDADREAALREASFERAYIDYRELLADSRVDVVHVCTPNASHCQIIQDALRAGKHVYAEKPLAISVPEAERIVRLMRDTARTTQLALEYRFQPALMRAKQLIEEGFVGNVYHFRGSYLHSGYIDPRRPLSWRMMKEQAGGGAMFDLGPHIFDVAFFLLGPFARVAAQARIMIPERPLAEQPDVLGLVDVDDYVCLQADMARGGYGILEASRLATGCQNDLRFEVHGSRGGLRFSLMDPNWLYAYDVGAPGQPLGGRRGWTQIETVQRYAESPFPGPKFEIGWTRYCLHNQFTFVNHVLHGEQGSPSFSDGLHIQRVMDAGYRSSDGGGAWLEVTAGD